MFLSISSVNNCLEIMLRLRPSARIYNLSIGVGFLEITDGCLASGAIVTALAIAENGL